jgi:hypothetical protein
MQISKSTLTVEMGLPVPSPMDATWLGHADNTLSRNIWALYVGFNIIIDNTVHYYFSNCARKKNMLVVNRTSIRVCYIIYNMKRYSLNINLDFISHDKFSRKTVLSSAVKNTTCKLYRVKICRLEAPRFPYAQPNCQAVSNGLLRHRGGAYLIQDLRCPQCGFFMRSG